MQIIDFKRHIYKFSHIIIKENGESSKIRRFPLYKDCKYLIKKIFKIENVIVFLVYDSIPEELMTMPYKNIYASDLIPLIDSNTITLTGDPDVLNCSKHISSIEIEDDGISIY